MYTFIHSFWRLIQRLFKRLLLRGTPSPVTDKKEGLQRDVKFGRVGHQQGTQLKGRSFHADGPTTEKALRCIMAKRDQGTKNSPLAAERRTRRSAKTDTGQQRSRR